MDRFCLRRAIIFWRRSSCFRPGVSCPTIGQEERTRGVLTETVNENAKAAGAVAEAAGGFLGAQALHDEGAQGLVLTVGGGAGLKEMVGVALSYLLIDLT